MKAGRGELKGRARKILLGHYGTAAGACLIYMAIAGGGAAVLELVLAGSRILRGTAAWGRLTEPQVWGGLLAGELLIGAVSFLLASGMNRMFYELCTQGRTRIVSLVWAFMNRPWKFAGVFLLFTAASALCMVPMIVLGAAAAVSPENAAFAAGFITLYSLLLCAAVCYVSLALSQYLVILVEDPRKGIFQALGESARLMRGNKGRFLLLGLSFLGMLFLGALSYGIGFFWIVPYMGCTNVLFYLDLRRTSDGCFYGQAE